ncbi:MAG: LPS-assembly protein LptD, partial [Gammaproteobacteria bacterium]
LMPGFGTSGSSGFEMSIPWYWNIAPNQDATFTPNYLRKRGTRLITNYRYLTHSSRGEVDVEYLDNDALLDMERYLIKYNNHSDIGQSVDFDITASDVSDIHYFDDLGSSISLSNITHLERTARLSWYGESWQAGVLAQNYETIDDTIAITSRPYRRLPQITLTGRDDLFDDQLLWSVSSEWVDFQHDSDAKTTGQRFDIYPRFSLPFTGNAWFVTPSVGWRLTRYDVMDETQTPLDIEDRSLSIASLDSGLFFERDIADGKYVQTLEPRLFYLNIPFEDQSAIPLFDTGVAAFSFSQLFRENRFNGIDRIGDANQLTIAISSRLLKKQHGDELLSLNLGQIFYYDDRRVQIDNSVVNSNRSNLISELRSTINNWSTRFTVQWDPEQDKTDQRGMQIKYQSQGNRIVNLGYRFRRDPVDETNNLEQTDFSFIWPVTSVYSLLGRWNYSLTEERDIEALFGIEYDSCCWAMRIVGQRYLKDDNSHDASLMLQLIFKGLGSVTDKQTTTTLKNAILGYQPEY